MLSPYIKIRKVIIVRRNRIIKIFRLNVKVEESIRIGPLNMVYNNIGNPNAKQISNILLPKAFEIASL